MILFQETYRDRLAIAVADLPAWRAWLVEHHGREQSIWLIIFRKADDRSSLTYAEAVDEGLCFGWIDSLPNKRDGRSYYQLFSPRNPKSNWSRVNKQKVARLLAQGRMAAPGLEMVRLAKRSGTWDALNDVEELVVPDDLRQALAGEPTAWKHWEDYPPSTKRGILEWLFNAKRATTRAQRIERTLAAARRGARPF
ncbi:hypothetical protein LEM8419_00742 [Neolewinella maritima]|uniref:Bacteriocin-protection protein n=1 Tax=Neolewinella maritima TaxID=1383882 RepID=A0ABM9AXQ4_9BACT|nr:YdeI/OmpD-associated family protein [Neolewinella maritima]CAH0999442.1 hypothetical protein LEM8419_00742 [Neolewinella maritima]